MAINFPNNRDQLVPPQPSGDIQTGDVYVYQGTTYVATVLSDSSVRWDAAVSAGSDAYVLKVGDTMSGQLTLPGGGTGSNAATVDQITSAIPAALWQRDAGTSTLSPVTADDNIDQGAGNITTTGDLSAAAGTFSGDVNGVTCFFNSTTTGVVGRFRNNNSTQPILAIDQQTAGSHSALWVSDANGTGNFTVANDGEVRVGAGVGTGATPNITLAADGQINATRKNVNIGLPVFNFVGQDNAGTQLSKLTMTVEGNVELKQGTAQTTNVFLGINGTCLKPGGGTWGSTSDERAKEEIADYPASLAEIRQLIPRSYRYIGNPHTYIGLVAQEAEGAMPELVTKGEGKLPDGTEVDDFRTLDQTPLTFALINAVKEMAARIEALEAEVQSLKGA